MGSTRSARAEFDSGVQTDATVHDPSRRTLLSGAAWAAPTVAIAVAAPARAASTGLSATFTAPVTGSGSAVYTLVVVNDSASPSDQPVTISLLTPGPSFIMGITAPPPWAVSSGDHAAQLTLNSAVPAHGTAQFAVSLLVDSEDDLVLIGQLTTGGGLSYPFVLQR